MTPKAIEQAVPDVLKLRADLDAAAEQHMPVMVVTTDYLRGVLDQIAQLQAELAEAREALKPFADCCDQIGDDEDDDEWAKFRLEVKNYRDAKRVAAAIEARDWSKP